MAERRVITADEMDKMTPNQRAAAVVAGTITDLETLPPAFRERVERKAQEWNDRLSAERRD